MTINEKYEIILGELAEAIKEKDTIIFLKDCEIRDLKTKLESCQTYIKEKSGDNGEISNNGGTLTIEPKKDIL